MMASNSKVNNAFVLEQQKTDDSIARNALDTENGGATMATECGDATSLCVDDVTVPFYVIVDDDEIAGEPERDNFLPKVSRVCKEGWRRSIATEVYDPSTDDSTDDEANERTAKTSSQRRRIAEAVKDTLLFRSLDDALTNRVIDAMFERNVEPNDYVIRQGDNGDNFYVIETGVYDVLKRSPHVNDDWQQLVLRLDGRGSFGELALMYNQPRAASVVSVTGGVLWAMNRKSFRRIVLRSAYRKRQIYERLLSNVSFLRPLSDYERASVADALRSITYSDGELIIGEGEYPPHGLYIVERGVAQVTVKVHQSSAPTTPACSSGDYSNRADQRLTPLPLRSTAVDRASTGTVEKAVAWLGVGDFFGEYALLENVPQSASVYAVASEGLPGNNEGLGVGQAAESDDEMRGKVVVAFIDGDSFDRLIGHYRSVMKREMHGRSASLSACEGL